MSPRPAGDRTAAWLSASEIGDYVYCPRSFWYRRHPPPGGRSAESRRASTAGDRFHTAHLIADQHRGFRARRGRTVLLIAVVLAAAAFVGSLLA
ncbi:MAG: hypothetical protein L3K15_05270 [Thermoplasmata archaeon]|nr:hypothetical protein [Thermoplasmata archaeon]